LGPVHSNANLLATLNGEAPAESPRARPASEENGNGDELSASRSSSGTETGEEAFTSDQQNEEPNGEASQTLAGASEAGEPETSASGESSTAN